MSTEESCQEEAPFPSNIHLLSPFPDEKESDSAHRKILVEFRTLMSEHESYNDLKYWLTDQQLTRFLIARNYEIRKSYDMILEAIKWRKTRRPDDGLLTAEWLECLKSESETGALYCPGFDKWNRPVLIFNSSVQATKNSVNNSHILFLAWNLEMAIRIMPPNIDKYVIFVHLDQFSVFNSPPMKVSIETLQMLSTCYPERLGHLIAYQPNMVLYGVYNTVKIFMDPKTVSKIHFISGDISDGSLNDLKLKTIIGDNWKVLCGAGQPVIKKGCSPGYDFEKYWQLVEERVASLNNQIASSPPTHNDDSGSFITVDNTIDSTTTNSNGNSSSTNANSEIVTSVVESEAAISLVVPVDSDAPLLPTTSTSTSEALEGQIITIDTTSK